MSIRFRFRFPIPIPHLFYFFFFIIIFSLLIRLILIIAPHILLHIRHNGIVRDPEDKIQPEEIDALQHGQQAEGDVLRDPALVLLGVPIEDEVADSAEGARRQEDFGQDDEVDVVPEVGPDEDEEGEVVDCDGGLDVVEGFGGLGFGSLVSGSVSEKNRG